TTCYRDWSSDVCSSDLTLFANGRTPFAAAPVPHTDRKPALYPANAVLVCQPSLRQCSASALFACVLSVILTEERSLQFQLRQDMRSTRAPAKHSLATSQSTSRSITLRTEATAISPAALPPTHRTFLPWAP